MSQAVSPITGRSYGLARVARVWRLARATLYRHRASDGAAAPSRPARPGPVGACSDAELVDHIRAQILGSRLHGEGYRKIWARLRHVGIRTAARLSEWRDRALVATEAAMKARERDRREEELLRLTAKLGEVTMANELLEQKVAALEGGRPLGRRRPRR